jgi:NAD+ kinase
MSERDLAPAAPVAPGAGSIQRVLVLADHEKEGVRATAAELRPWLEERVAHVEIEGDVRAFTRQRSELSDEQAAADRPDLVVVLGGDGAILGAVRAYALAPVPTLGINFGRVGFLASTPATRWRDSLEGILAGGGVVDLRMRLEAALQRNNRRDVSAVALNDVVVARGAHQGMLTLGLSVEGEWVTDYRADGLIVATPSGSTAHSLSAGGPILFPSMHGLIVTPVCPQGLSYRPIVLHPGSRLELVVKNAEGSTTLAVDGQGFYEMARGDRVVLTRHPVPYPLLAWKELDPYRRLRERLGWSGLIAPESPGPVQEGTDVGHGGVL